MKARYDLDVLRKEQLIGKMWLCAHCNHAETITEEGVDHRGYKHCFFPTLDDLFNEVMFNRHMASIEHKMLYYGKD